MSVAPRTSRPTRPRRPRPRSTLPTIEDNTQQQQSSTNRQIAILSEALLISEKTQIDMILERRQLEDPHIEQSRDVAPPKPGGVPHGRQPQPQPQRPMTADELTEAYTDVYGRPPPDVARMEERLAALEREVDRLPLSEREALTKAMAEHPLLFVNCPHTKMILEHGGGGGDGEDDVQGHMGDVESNAGEADVYTEHDDEFDATAAARRLARYWERRRSLFGDQECYAPGTFQRDTFSGYKRLYARTLAVATDPDSDDAARDKAENFVRVVHDVKVQALNTLLEQRRDTADAQIREHVLSALQSPDDLKLCFLQAEDFNETKASRRMISHWKLGRRLFGPSFWTSGCVTLKGIDDCSELLRSHQSRLMPKEDDCGRPVLIVRNLIGDDKNEESTDCLSMGKLISLGINENHYAKTMWYSLQALLERESCRRNGSVILVDMRIRNVHFHKFKPHREALASVFDAFPVKVCAIHLIMGPDVPWWQQVMTAMAVAVGNMAHFSRRFVVHAGADEDTIAKLERDFGIGRDNLPVNLGGTIDDGYFSRWLEERGAAGL